MDSNQGGSGVSIVYYSAIVAVHVDMSDGSATRVVVYDEDIRREDGEPVRDAATLEKLPPAEAAVARSYADAASWPEWELGY